jgi:hypothetical protein
MITGRGARVLLGNAEPYSVQVDALMGLTATYDPSFRMFWPVSDIAHPSYWRRSQLWDGCLKCYVPVGGTLYAFLLCFVVVGVAGGCWVGMRKRKRCVN